MTRHNWTSVSGHRFTAIDVQSDLRSRRIRYAWASIKSTINDMVGRTRASNAASSSVLLIVGTLLVTQRIV